MSTTSSQVAERILTYVMQAQLEYVEFSKNHPFLEQTITNLAIQKRTSQSYLESLQLWEWLKQIQEEVYGPDSEVIIYTYKNIGICYLAMGIPEKSEEYYLKALTLMEQMQSEGDSVADPELLKEDREQMASIYNNLYLSSVTNNEKDKAKQYIQKTLHFQNLVYGENSIQASNCQYIQSNCCLKLGQIDEAIECMNQAIKVFDNPDEELKRAKDEMLLIKVRYFNQFASIYFIKGEYPKAKECIDQAYTICNDPTNYTYETAEPFKKSLIEVE